MANRSDYYYRQKVTEAELDQGFNDLEVADRNLAKDIGVVGVISGGVIQENSPQAFNVLASASCVAYDQAGQRIAYGPQQTIDCTVDRDGSPTLPSAGNKRILMITLAFDRLLDDLRTDGNGANVYYRRLESFALYVTAGAETAGTPSPPSAPSDELILADITILDTTTVITNSDIDYSRAQAFVYTTADNIGINASGFLKISNAVTDVSAALYSVDNELISRDGSGYIDQTLIPDATSRDLGASLNPWGAIWAAGSIRHDGSGTPDVGDVTNPYNEVFASTVTADTVKVDTAIQAVTGDELVGSAGSRFTGHFDNLTVYTALLASADGKALGAAGERFAAFLNSIDYYGALAGTFQFSSAKTIIDMIPISDFTSLGGTDWDWNSTGAYLQCTTGAKVMHIRFKIPDGVKLVSMRIRWSQASGTGMTAQIQSVDEDNAGTNVGSAKTNTKIGVGQDWEVIASGLTETAASSSEYHRVVVTSAAAAVQSVYMLEATYEVTDILKAAFGPSR